VKSYTVAPEAEDDLQNIWRSLLGAAGLAIANRIQSELLDAFEDLADVPG
jgi:plasmid stabilization system protein ParE